MKIRVCNIYDVDKICHLQPEGWDDIVSWFRFYCLNQCCYPVIGEINGFIIALGAGIRNYNTSWIGHVIVDYRYRGKGYGYQITGHLINKLLNFGSRTISLIATKDGINLYRKFGFRQDVNYYFFRKKSETIHTENDSNIRMFERDDYSKLLGLDIKVYGEFRHLMLQNFLNNAWVYDENKKVNGFLLNDFCEGMIVANNETAGISLLKKKFKSRKFKTVLPENNQAAIDFLLTSKFELYDSLPRMIYGDDLTWYPKGIYSRAGGFYG